jgi:Uma2 family endonuclease
MEPAMTTLQQPQIEQVLAELAEKEAHIYLPGVSWDFYKAVVEAVGARPRLRITFDRGDMELMTISGRHDSYKHLLGLFFVILAEELNVDIKGFGACTLKGEDLEHGLEADEWFYTRHELQVRAKLDLDLRVDPPPDVAIEIEVSRKVVLSREDVYAAMRVPELWRFDGQSLTAHQLGADGKYQMLKRSPTFPNVPLEELVRFVQMATTMSETALIRLFRDWVRQHIVPTWQSPGDAHKP